MREINQLRVAMVGRWQQCYNDLFPSLADSLGGHKALCPFCNASESFRVDLHSEDGRSYCSCGSRRGIDFVRGLLDTNMIETVKVLNDWLDSGGSEIDQSYHVQRIASYNEEKIRRAQRWIHSIENKRQEVGLNAPIEILRMLFDWGFDHDMNCKFYWAALGPMEYGSNDFEQQPCVIVEVVQCSTEERVALQIIPVAAPKRQTYMTCANRGAVYGDIWGGITTFLAEGVKTAVAASRIHGLTVTPMIDAPSLSIYDGKVFGVFADKDRSKAGERAAEKLAKSQNDCFVEIPARNIPRGRKSFDWYDELVLIRDE